METILDGGYGLIEGPVWDPKKNGLYFSDVENGGVYFYNTISKTVELAIPHRKGIGGMSLHSNGLIISGRNIAYKPLSNPTATIVIRDRDEKNGLIGYNDITTDSQGRLLVGGMAHVPPSTRLKGSTSYQNVQSSENLYLIDLDGNSKVVGTDIKLTNGLAFSPDNKVLYHSDTPTNSVWMYKVTDEGTTYGRKNVFAKVASPDGLCVAEDGSVYVASASSGSVKVFNPDGSKRKHIEVPLRMVTSVCFGGNDLHDLYIVTGSLGTGSIKKGSIFRIKEPVAGLCVPECKVKLDYPHSKL